MHRFLRRPWALALLSLLAVAGVVDTFAEAENLPAHGAAVRVRRGGDGVGA